MKKSLLTVGLAVMSANVLGMNYPEQGERRFSTNMVSISELSERIESLTVNSGMTTWWNDGLRDGKDGFLKIIKEKKKKCKGREKKIKAFNSKDSNGRSILMYAAKNADMEIMTLLLDMNVIDINAKDINGNTALLIASETGDIEKMRFLLSRGADVNAINNNGQTALSIIASSGSVDENKEKLRLLFKYGANLDSLENAQDIHKLEDIQKKIEKERTNLTKAVLSGEWLEIKGKLKNWEEVNTCVSKVVVENGKTKYLNQISDEPILFRLVNHCNSDDIKSFIEDKSYFVDVDKKGPSGVTSLGLAIQQYSSAQKDLKSAMGRSALQSEKLQLKVLCEEWEKIIEILLNNSINVDVQDDNGVTLLMRAISSNVPDVARNIIKKSKNINLRSKSGNTALMLSIDQGCFEITRAIVEKGGDVDIQDEHGNTALMRAIEHCKGEECDIVKLLIDKSSNVDIKNKRGDNALMFAISKLAGIEEIAKLIEIEESEIDAWKKVISKLIDKTEDVNSKGSSGMTAYSMIAVLNHEDICQKLSEKIKLKQEEEDDLVLNAYFFIRDNNVDQLKELLKKQGTMSASILTKEPHVSETNVSIENLLLPTRHSLGNVILSSGNPEIWQLFFDHLQDKDKDTYFGDKLKKAIELAEEVKEKFYSFLAEELAESDRKEAIRKQEEQAERERINAIQNQMNQKWLEGDIRVDLKTKAVSSSFINAVRAGNLNQIQNLLLLENERGERLISQNTINEGFLLAAERGHKKGIETLLDEAYVNYKDPKTGNTALMLAAQNGHLKVVGDLVANGATIDINNNGYTALRFAAENGHADVVEYLLNAEARTRYLSEILGKVKERIAQNDSLIENYKKIQEMLNERQQDDFASSDSSESEEEIKTWSVYFWNNASKDYGSLDENQKKETDRLLSEIQKNPFERRTTPGQKPEPLYGNLSGFFSRRINGEDRLVYRVKGDCIYVVACNDHYEDLYNLSKSEIRSLSSFSNEWKNDILIKF